MNTATLLGERSPRTPGASGVTLLAAVLIGSPLLQWLYLTALSHFTLLEPPFTASRGLVLAMQLFFSPGNVLAIVLGVGLMRRSERMRRVARVLFLIALGLAALQVGMQVAVWRFDSNALLAGTTLVVSTVYLWYFGRASVKRQFQARTSGAIQKPVAAPATSGVPAAVAYPRALVVCACVESLLGLAAVLLLAHLYAVFRAEPLLDMGGGASVAAADELLKMFLFVSLALLISPHVLSAVASVGILLGRNTAGMARRYSLVACWSVVGCLLLTAWLVMRPGFAFDTRSAQMLFAFCGFSLVWHACFLYALARWRSPSGMPTGGKVTR